MGYPYPRRKRKRNSEDSTYGSPGSHGSYKPALHDSPANWSRSSSPLSSVLSDFEEWTEVRENKIRKSDADINQEISPEISEDSLKALTYAPWDPFKIRRRSARFTSHELRSEAHQEILPELHHQEVDPVSYQEVDPGSHNENLPISEPLEETTLDSHEANVPASQQDIISEPLEETIPEIDQENVPAPIEKTTPELQQDMFVETMEPRIEMSTDRAPDNTLGTPSCYSPDIAEAESAILDISADTATVPKPRSPKAPEIQLANLALSNYLWPPNSQHRASPAQRSLQTNLHKSLANTRFQVAEDTKTTGPIQPLGPRSPEPRQLVAHTLAIGKENKNSSYHAPTSEEDTPRPFTRPLPVPVPVSAPLSSGPATKSEVSVPDIFDAISNTTSSQAEKSFSPVSSPAILQDVRLDIQENDDSSVCIPVTQPSSPQWLETLSRKLTAYPPTPKPAPSARPEVWAEGRMEMCETLPYFRAYQGACYSSGGYVRGFMFDKCAHPRDYTDGSVIISRAAGGMVKDRNGEMVAGTDQSRNSRQCEALYNNMAYKCPVVIIAGLDNPTLPCQPPHAYCVLDYFKPTHIWNEKSQTGKNIVRFRFEKLNRTKPSWWTPEGTEESIELELPPPHAQDCAVCGNKFEMIYLNGWMCLEPSCERYWKLPDDTEPVQENLLYDPRWLKQRTPWPIDSQNFPLYSDPLESSGYGIIGEDCSLAYWRGIVCPLCGRCSSRLSWTGWECGNSDCNYTKSPPHTLIPALALRDPYNPLSSSYALSRDTHQAPVSVAVSFAHNYRINTYTIPGIEGCITHMIANKAIIEAPDGPDAMFEELQLNDIGLRRRPMGTALKGESHTRHFTVNYGMPYKFIAATASKSFNGAAKCITNTRSRLNWAAKTILGPEQWAQSGGKEKEFNEVLALGYFEEQKINYHDDGEYGLGPTIATLSLGAPGTMKIRMKAKHYNGVSTAGVYVSDSPIPGCKSHSARLAALPTLQALQSSSPSAYRARLKSLPKELGLKSGGNAKDAITMNLAHGDVVIMHGAGIQRYFEHAVEHGGKLRFALTCRYIDPESLGEGDRPEYVVGWDEGGYDGCVEG